MQCRGARRERNRGSCRSPGGQLHGEKSFLEESEKESGWQSGKEGMVLKPRDQHVQRPRGMREADTVRKL